MTRDRSKDSPKTAAQLMRELQSDPDYVSRIQKRERERQVFVESYRQSAQPLINELASMGVHVDTIGDLRRRGFEYSTAIPVLIRWLPQISDPAVKEDIVRTLSVPWAKPFAAVVLIEEFEKADILTGNELRWAIANGLAVVADDSVFDKLSELAQDKRYGAAREMLALALANMKNPKTISVLLGLLDDDQMVGHAAMALGMLKASSARDSLEALKGHSREWVREEVQKALGLIGSSSKVS